MVVVVGGVDAGAVEEEFEAVAVEAGVVVAAGAAVETGVAVEAGVAVESDDVLEAGVPVDEALAGWMPVMSVSE